MPHAGNHMVLENKQTLELITAIIVTSYSDSILAFIENCCGSTSFMDPTFWRLLHGQLHPRGLEVFSVSRKVQIFKQRSFL